MSHRGARPREDHPSIRRPNAPQRPNLPGSPALPRSTALPARPHYTALLIGGTGQGKSTLLNMLTNFFRSPPELRKRLPTVSELRCVIPTKYLKPTEPEGQYAREADVEDRKPLVCSLVLRRKTRDGQYC